MIPVITDSDSMGKVFEATRKVLGVGQFNGQPRPAPPRRFMVAPACFMVKVSNDGGSAGDGSTTCTFTYTVTDYGGTQLGTAVTVLCSRARALKCAVTAGTNGEAFWDDTTSPSTLYLWDVDETQTQCNQAC